MRYFREYDDFIFDLYGTLIDVHTDEGSASLWRGMAEWYSVFGADYFPDALAEKYRRTVAEEEASLGKASGTSLPEIKLETVFIRLFDEAPSKRPARLSPQNKELWASDTANVFRILSRDRLFPYDGVRELLEGLRRLGKRTFLLSNAQAVFTVPEIEVCKLSGLFDGMWLSSERGVRKPERSFMEGLLAEYGIDKRGAVMVGNDWYTDMMIAAACGVDGMWINSDVRSDAEKEAARHDVLASHSGAFIAEAESISDLVGAL